MAPRHKGNPSKAKSRAPQLPTLHPHAAGIDLGAREIYVAVPPGSDPRPVRAFPTFTEDLQVLRDWLQACGVTTVAMESTGVYWIALFQILEAAGIEVCLVNARHCKNLPGRKTDVQDCQWLQYLHSVGLLRGSFRPTDQVCAVRTILRHRDALVRGAGFATPTVLVLLCELGPEFAAKFPTAKHFGSWLGLCPDNRITGGKIYSVRTRDVKSRVAEALRPAAQSLWQAKNYFGELYRRWKARLGSPNAITAMAHKLARILWHLLKYKQPFNPEVFATAAEKMKRKKLARLQTLATTLNYRLVPNQ
jgi:transposase